MGIRRFTPAKDTWITSKATAGANVRATGSCLGTSALMQVFKITSSFPTADAELARTLLYFDTSVIQNLVNLQIIPSSSVSYFLKMRNCTIQSGPPQGFDLEVCALSGTTFDEGLGTDDLQFTDYGYANWNYATSVAPWTSAGGDYYSQLSGTQHFDSGFEDLEVNISPLVSAWISGTLPNRGLMVKLSNTCETNQNDYYPKAFFSSETHYVENMPFLEARWNDVRKDNRKNFGYNAPNALFMYYFVRGSLTNVSNPPVSVTVQDNMLSGSASYRQTFSASMQETGVYAAPVRINTAVPVSYSSSFLDIWTDANGTCLMTGTFTPLVLTGSQFDPYNRFVVASVEMKREYFSDEYARINVNVTKQHYNNQIVYRSASLDFMREYMEDMYFSVVDNQSGNTIIPFGTGSVPYTKLSYDGTGNYFQIDMGSFVPGFTYRFLFLIYYNKYEKYIVDDNSYVFKVV